jgi:hypothetical protein
MRTKLLSIVLVLAMLSLAFPAMAQDSISETPITGSTFNVASRTFDASPFSGPGLNQVGAGGQAEATAGMVWYIYPHTPGDNIIGIARSKIINGTSTYNVCAQVLEMRRDGANQGGSSRVCGEIGVGSQLEATKRLWQDPSGHFWLTRTWHSFSRTGVYWAPIVETSQNI